MKREIFETYLQDHTAFTVFPEKFIVIDKRLRKYPSLRKLVLKHEMGHLKDKTINQYLLRDMRDYPRMMLNEHFHDYIRPKFKDELNIFKQWKDFLGILYYKTMNALFVFPLSCIIAGSVIINKKFRKNDKKK